MKIVFAALVFGVGIAAQAAAIPDIQAMMAEEVKKDGVLLVRNDVHDPFEVRTTNIGKYLLCLSMDFSKATLYPVTKNTFPRNETTVLVRCQDGRFYIGRGYI